MNKTLCLLSAMILTACASEPPPPSKVKLTATPTTSQQGSAEVYRCNEDKEVKIVRAVKKSKTAKNANTIQVTFNNVTEKLVPTITEKGKKYTNIHWQWLEQDNSQLVTSIGVILAENCIKQ